LKSNNFIYFIVELLLVQDIEKMKVMNKIYSIKRTVKHFVKNFRYRSENNFVSPNS